MLDVRNVLKKSIFDNPVDLKFRIPFGKLEHDEKMPITSDTMFHTIILNETRIIYSAKLFSYLLNIEYQELLEHMHLCKNELDKKTNLEKGRRADFVARYQDTYLNIEVNNNYSKEMMERNVEYALRLYSSNVKKGKENAKYMQTIQINLNNFALDEDTTISPCYIQDHKGRPLTKKLIFIQVYIPNIAKKCYNESAASLTEAEKYILLMSTRSIKQARELGKGDPIMEKFIEESIDCSHDIDLLQSYDKEEALKDMFLKEGKSIGVEQGKSIGIEQGKSIGIEQIARKMVSENLSIDLIERMTGLSRTRIEELKKDSQ